MSDPSPSAPPTLEGTVSVHDFAEAQALLAAGGTLQRHAHQMRLALPVAAVIMVLVRHVHDLYKDSEIYSGVDEPEL